MYALRVDVCLCVYVSRIVWHNFTQIPFYYVSGIMKIAFKQIYTHHKSCIL